MCFFVVVFAIFCVNSQEFCMYMTMKKILGLIFVSMTMFLMASCEPVQWGDKFEYFYDNIYTVNKHAVYPEFSDSFVIVSNMDSTSLKTGDRARMILRYYYDSSSGKKPQYSIYYLGDIIPTRSLDSIAGIDTLEYNSLFKNLEFYDFWDRYANPVWVWNNCQNINVSYYGLKDGAEFAMAVKGVDNEYLELELFAKATRSNNVANTILLTYNLSNADEFLTYAQKKSLEKYDTLKTRIYLDREVKDELNGKIYTEKINFIGGKFANPF